MWRGREEVPQRESAPGQSPHGPLLVLTHPADRDLRWVRRFLVYPMTVRFHSIGFSLRDRLAFRRLLGWDGTPGLEYSGVKVTTVERYRPYNPCPGRRSHHTDCLRRGHRARALL